MRTKSNMLFRIVSHFFILPLPKEYNDNQPKKRMKKSIFLLSSALCVGLCAQAQTEVTVGVMQGKDYGVTYMLPQTEIEIVVHATRHTYTPGEFCRYAERYLRLTGVSDETKTYWTLDKVETRTIGVPDKNNVYFVKLKDKTVAPLMELTEDGIVRSINMPFSGDKGSKPQRENKVSQPTRPIDPRNFMTEEILMASSRAKMAELTAKEIFSIRESKNALIRGEADNMPTDGEQLKLMLDNLKIQEEAMTALFTGKEEKESTTFTIRLTPREMKEEVVFRFSQKLGPVDKDDLSGAPIYMNISNLETPTLASTEEDKKKEKEGPEGVVYNVPGRAQVCVTYGKQTLFDGEMPITQFGTQECLAPVLFNKKATTKVLFDTTTGGLIKIDRKEN